MMNGLFPILAGNLRIPGNGGPSGGLQPSEFSTEELTIVSLTDGPRSTLIVPDGAGGSWDAYIREIGNVFDEGVDGPQRYKLPYTGHTAFPYYDTTPTYVGYAYSADGLSWTKGGQLITTRKLEDPWLMKVDGVYYLYAEDKEDNPFRNIRLYTSDDFATWTDRGDILDAGASGAWDDQDVSSPVVWVENGVWKMLFEGRKSGGQQGAVGLATSNNGLTWTKDPANPVHEAADVSWASAVVPDDIMMADDGTYVVLLHGKSVGSGFFRAYPAVTNDLYNWSTPLAGASTRHDLTAGFDHFVAQYHPHGGQLELVYYEDGGPGIRRGRDMGWEALVVNFTGPNGSTTFTDQSRRGITLTAYGNAQILNNKLELDGNGDYVSTPSHRNWDIYTGDFTFEFFGVEFDANSVLYTLMSRWQGVGKFYWRMDYRGDLSPDILRFLGDGFYDDTPAWTPAVATPYDITFERYNGVLSFYINGVRIGTSVMPESIGEANAAVWIGANYTSNLNGAMNGRMKALRATVGKALYQSSASYPVPSLPLIPA